MPYKTKGNEVMKLKSVIKIILIIIVLTLIAIGIWMYIENNKKEYNITEVSQYNYYKLYENNKYGVIDTSGNTIIEPIYDNVKIPNPEKAVFICENADKIIVLNENSEQIFTEYDEVTAISINGIVTSLPYEKKVLCYKSDSKYGLIDYSGKIITQPIYEEIKGLENKESELLVKRDGKYGVINAKGAILIKEQYDEIIADGYYSKNDQYGLSGYIVSNKTTDGYRYGYISSKLKTILEVEHNLIIRLLNIEDTQNIYLISAKNGQYGVMKNKDVLIDYSYQGIEYDTNNNVFELQRNSKYGIADINGTEIIKPEYDEIQIKGMYIEAIKNEEEPRYFNANGTEIVDLKYTTKLKTANENYYIVINKDGLYGMVNNEDKELINLKYSYLEYLFGEYFIVSNELGKLGVINSHDETVVEFKYDVLQKIDDTKIVEAKILKQNISEIYNEKLEPVYSGNKVVIYRKEDYIKVSTMEEEKYFDFTGTELTVQQVFPNNKLFASKKDNKWGFVDLEQKLIVEHRYDKVTEFNEYGYARIKKDNKWGIIHENGTVVVEPSYEIQDSNIEQEFLGRYYKIYYGYGESYYTSLNK